jgi:hypothetical protein
MQNSGIALSDPAVQQHQLGVAELRFGRSASFGTTLH